MKSLKIVSILLASFVGMTSSIVYASDDVPDSYKVAMEIYKEDGSKGMLKAMFTGSPISEDSAIESIDTELKKAEIVCGDFVDYDFIKRVDLSKSAMVLFTQLNYKKCPMFVYQIYYKTGKNWVVTQINFDTNPANIYPQELLVD